MARKRRLFQRPLGGRRYRKLFLIAVEGVKTEPQYFSVFNNDQSIVRINCLRGSYDSSPPHVLKRMEKYLKKESLRNTDEAWLVVDKDNWTDNQLSLLYNWSQTRQNYGFALSNPKFEIWLLLHFEDGAGVSNSRQCSERLQRYLPNYDKGIDARKISQDKVIEAINRASLRDTPQCEDWPRTINGKWSCIKNTIRFWVSSDLSTEYLFFATFGKDFWPKRGAAQPFISQGDAKGIQIVCPNGSLVDRFSLFAATVLSQIDVLETKNQNLRQTRDLLLPKLISGEVAV